MTQTNVEMAFKTPAWILEILKKQGVNFLLLALAVWWLNTKLEKVEDEYKQCNSKVIEMYETILIANQKVIERNTTVLLLFEEKSNEAIKNQN